MSTLIVRHNPAIVVSNLGDLVMGRNFATKDDLGSFVVRGPSSLD
jgi:hypothetical protein